MPCPTVRGIRSVIAVKGTWMRIKSIAIAAAVILSSLASAGAQTYIFVSPPKVSEATVGDYSDLHRACLISTIGGTLTLDWKGSFFGTPETHRDITDWKIDDEVRSFLGKLLSPRFETVEIPVDSVKVAEETDPGFRRNHVSDLQKFLRDLNRSDCDAFIVVRPNYYGALPINVGGLSFQSGPHVSEVWANYNLLIFDAKTLQLRGDAFSRLQFTTGDSAFAGLTAPEGLMLSDKAELADDQV